MRLLAFSDIHHNLVAVRKLRACEKNRFDAILVAGDIGNESAAEFFRILASFECPVMYVYGNWDNKLDYESCFGPSCALIHSNVITIGEVSFTGFSGCPTDWGKNPLALSVYRRIESENKRVVDALNDGPGAARKIRLTRAYQKYASELHLARGEILKLNRASVARAVEMAAVDPRRCIVVTHERVARLNAHLPNALLHLYGHLHSFSDRTFMMTRYVDVAALDRPISARPRGRRKWNLEDCRNFNAGNYVVIEIASSAIQVECLQLPHGYPDWIPLVDRRYNGIAWIPEELQWTKASDWPIPSRTTRIAG
jgi:Calcineurin-like phosphoesterase superfamily domain